MKNRNSLIIFACLVLVLQACYYSVTEGPDEFYAPNNYPLYKKFVGAWDPISYTADGEELIDSMRKYRMGSIWEFGDCTDKNRGPCYSLTIDRYWSFGGDTLSLEYLCGFEIENDSLAMQFGSFTLEKENDGTIKNDGTIISESINFCSHIWLSTTPFQCRGIIEGRTRTNDGCLPEATNDCNNKWQPVFSQDTSKLTLIKQFNGKIHRLHFVRVR